LPARFGDWNIVYQRFNRWAKSGVFDRIFKLLANDADNEYMMIDASIVRAHQHSAGARKKTARTRVDETRPVHVSARYNPTLADAILDRVIHNAYRIELAGESMRKRRMPEPSA
jgi:hypothetical protein